MYTQNSISVDLPSSQYRNARTPLFKTYRLKFIKAWRAMLTKCGITKQRTFYISAEELGDQAEQTVDSLSTLYAKKKNWSSNDILRLQRNGVFHDDGSFQKLKDAGVFIEAYGHGANPLIKTNNTYVEVDNTTWF